MATSAKVHKVLKGMGLEKVESHTTRVRGWHNVTGDYRLTIDRTDATYYGGKTYRDASGKLRRTRTRKVTGQPTGVITISLRGRGKGRKLEIAQALAAVGMTVSGHTALDVDLVVE